MVQIPQLSYSSVPLLTAVLLEVLESRESSLLIYGSRSLE